jgi:hypothetical protein
VKTVLPALTLAALLAACSEPLPVADNATPVAVNGTEEVMPAESDAAPPANAGAPVAARTQDDYLGRWIGVEGMVLDVAAKPGGGVTLDMQWSIEDKGRFDGAVTADGLRFTRNGVAETARFTDGDATGLKWLAGKRECLTVKPGEGYCRA